MWHSTHAISCSKIFNVLSLFFSTPVFRAKADAKIQPFFIPANIFFSPAAISVLNQLRFSYLAWKIFFHTESCQELFQVGAGAFRVVRRGFLWFFDDLLLITQHVVETHLHTIKSVSLTTWRSLLGVGTELGGSWYGGCWEERELKFESLESKVENRWPSHLEESLIRRVCFVGCKDTVFALRFTNGSGNFKVTLNLFLVWLSGWRCTVAVRFEKLHISDGELQRCNGARWF